MPSYSLDALDLYVGCPVGPANPNDLIFLIRDDGGSISFQGIKLDPKKDDDVLTVNGTEFKGPSLQKLGNALRLSNTGGSIAVNSQGNAIIGILANNSWYKPLGDLKFDWYAYGVVVPGSTIESLQAQLKNNETEYEALSQQLSETKKELEEKKQNESEGKSIQGILDFVKQEYAECKAASNAKNEELKKVREELGYVKCELKFAKSEKEKLEAEVKKLKGEVPKCEEKGEEGKGEALVHYFETKEI